ncbi:MAG: vWA domain-containing protein [Planctomycetales bacterium]
MSATHPAATLAPRRQRAGSSSPEESGGESSRWAKLSLRAAPGWMVSLGIHVLALMAMLAIKIHTESAQDNSILSSLEDLESDQFVESAAADQVGTSADVTSLTAPSAVALTSSDAVQQEVQRKVEQEFKAPDVQLSEDREMISEAELTGTVELPGGSTENMAQGQGGAEGAIDRLAWEITQSLRQGKTTVIWLFDQSLSLKERRDAIADRFEIVYRQLESLDEGSKGALQTVAATYGEKFSLLTDKPVEDVHSLIPKVREIPDDPSGKENVFDAVHKLAVRFKGERAKKRQVLIFIITDEKGDDAEKNLEETLLLCRRTGIKVYCVGNAALFGREKGYVKWRYPDGYVDDEPVDSGPETVEPEAIAMGFWGGRGPDLSRMSSGYGPYALTRLCKETGGLFFIAHEDQRGPTFPPAVMRNYQPDYRPIKDYQASLNKNKAKMALVTMAKQSKLAKLDTIPLPRLNFPAYNDNVLREEITEAQKPAATISDPINRLAEVLTQAEKDREKIAEPRWRAAFDLAIGRVLAMKVRLYGYNQMLAEMKGTPKTFQKKESNEWRIVPSKTINAGQAVKKMERQASMYLKRVVDDHPETPWASLAARELSTPMGWEWQEGHNPSSFPPNTSNEEARRQIRLAEEQAKAMPKKMAPAAPPRERPKL